MSEPLEIHLRGHVESKTPPGRELLVTWLPLGVLPSVALITRLQFPPWMQMWVIAVAIFAGFKWATWRLALARGVATTRRRELAYLLLWPGMDARKFLSTTGRPQLPAMQDWAWATAKMIFGAVLLWGIARLPVSELAAGWIGMVGLIFLLHFGAFDLLVFFWRRHGIDVQPFMNFPVLSVSVGDFWGRRWNSAFHELAFGLMFRPLIRHLGVPAAMMATFIGSGLIHDLVISIPAGSGYGLPTVYFTMQGAAILVERSTFGLRIGQGNPIVARLFTWGVVAAPVGLLFPPQFVERVIVPFLRVIHAVP